MEQWFFSKDGEQEGPVTPEQIRGLVAAGHLDPASSFVWKEGLADWKSIADSGILGVAAPALQSYRASDIIAQGNGRPTVYPGSGRLRYFLTQLIIVIVTYAVLFLAMVIALRGGGESGGFMGILILITMLAGAIFGFYNAYLRVKNLGMSGWALLWLIVPFMNFWMGWRMIACPGGYEEHRTLDAAGKAISWVFAGFIILMLVLNIAVALTQ